MGVLEGPTGMKLSKHTFVGDKGDYYGVQGIQCDLGRLRFAKAT
jgi:hypothetical protein